MNLHMLGVMSGGRLDKCNVSRWGDLTLRRIGMSNLFMFSSFSYFCKYSGTILVFLLVSAFHFCFKLAAFKGVEVQFRG